MRAAGSFFDNLVFHLLFHICLKLLQLRFLLLRRQRREGRLCHAFAL